MGLGEVFSDFANWSTVGGVPHIANANTWLVRIFWTIVVLIMSGIFGYQLFGMITQFIGFPAVISTVISIEQQTFPAVTICNLNPYKKVTSSPSNFDTALSTFMTYYSTVVAGTATADTYGILNMDTTWDRDTRARDVVNMIAGQYPDLVSSSLYTFDEIIADCTFNGISCTESDFTEFIDPSYGRCFTYNNLLNSSLSVSRAGKTFGLNLLITVHQTDIDDTNSLYYPLFTTAGAKVSVHSPTEYPNVEGTALTVGVGYTTAVAITVAEYILSKKPYGTCIDSDSADRNYYTAYKYSSLTCYNSCRQRDANTKCSCYNPRYLAPDDATFCEPTPTNVACIDGLKGDQYSDTQTNMDPFLDCKCNPPCNELTYSLTTSLSTFPTDGYTVVADPVNASSTAGMGSCTADNTKFASIDECEEWYSYNALQLQVFFETMRKETYTESSSYGISAMVNDLGGQAGLYLGFSVISLVECVGLLILLCLYCVTGGRVAIKPYDDDFERDHRIMEIEDFKKALDEHERLDKAQKAMQGDKKDTSSDDESDHDKKDEKKKEGSEVSEDGSADEAEKKK